MSYYRYHLLPSFLAPYLPYLTIPIQIFFKALSAASEARHLEELNDAMVPKLYAQLYELRRAGDAWRDDGNGIGGRWIWENVENWAI